MDIEQAELQFKELINAIDPQHLPGFLRCIKDNIDDRLHEATHNNNDAIMEQIRHDLREALPENATLDSETIVFPAVGENADCNPASTVHMDGFLYDDDTIDELCDEGKMSRNYCLKCGSHQVSPLTFISHSSSLSQIKYIYEYLLPDLRGKSLLDIGSRTGALLYGACLYSECQNIVGVELNEGFCKVQDMIVQRFKLQDKIKVVHGDVCTKPDLLQSADVIIMNNVFEFFAPLNIQERIWCFLHENVRKSGTLLVVSPSLEESLLRLKTDIDLALWVQKTDCVDKFKVANLHLFGNGESEQSNLGDIHLYQVL